MTSSEIKTYKYRKDPPYGLQDQIRHAEDDVVEIVEDLKDNGAKDVRVVLVGHSVGAYMSLEIVRRLRAHGLAGEDFDTRIAGVVGLFPTVVDIARSESGMKASVSRHISFINLNRHIANHVTSALPQKLQLRTSHQPNRRLHHNAHAPSPPLQTHHSTYGLSL